MGGRDHRISIPAISDGRKCRVSQASLRSDDPMGSNALADHRHDQAALWRKVEEFASDPFASRAWAKPLVGQRNAVRLRQGDWRAVCRIDRAGETVIVEAIGNRREIYR